MRPADSAGIEPVEEHVAKRYELLQRIQRKLEIPMLALALLWVALLVVEIVWGINPFLAAVGAVVWAAFVLQLGLELAIAPRKLQYLRRNWLNVAALALPALRVLRVFRLAQLVRISSVAGVARGARLVQVLGSLSRSMHALRATMSRRGFSYVLLLTLIVTFAGAAGMYAFEREAFEGYASALWWAAMLISTTGSQYWPVSSAGRILCLLLAVYGLGVFGYLTAMLATFFIGLDARRDDPRAATEESIIALRKEILELREELRDSRGSGDWPNVKARPGDRAAR
jgi:voltage-gated potassium channel